MKIKPQQNKAIHALLAQLEWAGDKQRLVLEYTGGRTASSKDMLSSEADSLIGQLKQEKQRLMKKTAGKVIHLLCLLGYVLSGGEPDYPRINNYVANIGSRNPSKRALHKLTRSELTAVCTQVEQWYKKAIANESERV